MCRNAHAHGLFLVVYQVSVPKEVGSHQSTNAKCGSCVPLTPVPVGTAPGEERDDRQQAKRKRACKERLGTQTPTFGRTVYTFMNF
jgi:hypothetical protein